METRYTQVRKGEEGNHNYLFLPGGPGADSAYLRDLIDVIDLPGHMWLIDLPGNGSNTEGVPDDYDYDEWMELFPGIIERFENPVLVGHSFGGMLPLLYPELEERLCGFAIVSSVPVLWLEEAAAYAAEMDMPDVRGPLGAFVENPSQETFDVALAACMPYYFPPWNLEEGGRKLTSLPFTYKPAVWWQTKAIELNFDAKWIPQEVPTLIIGGKYDAMCPFRVFQKDKRFARPNIELRYLENAGHCGWLEDPASFREAFADLNRRLHPATSMLDS